MCIVELQLSAVNPTEQHEGLRGRYPHRSLRLDQRIFRTLVRVLYEGARLLGHRHLE